MPSPKETLDAEFDAQLRDLYQAAEEQIHGVSSPAPAPKPATAPTDTTQPPAEDSTFAQSESKLAQEISQLRKQQAALPAALKSLVKGIEGVSQSADANAIAIDGLKDLIGLSSDAHKAWPSALADLKAVTEQRVSVSQKMFDALHEELKAYKDAFLLDAIQRPLIRDLIHLYDDLTEAKRSTAVTDASDATGTALQNLTERVEHSAAFIIEILARIGVEPMDYTPGKLDKQRQRAMTVEPAATPEEDLDVVALTRRGFMWRDRVIRPEEVAIKRWLPPNADKKAANPKS